MDKVFIGIGALTICSIPLLIYASIVEHQQWQEFAKAHECRPIAHSNGYYTSGAGFRDGKMITTSHYHPSRETYRCNDGVDYTR